MLFAVLALLFLISFRWEIYNILGLAWVLLALVALSLAVLFSVRGFRRRIPESGLFLAGTIALSVGTMWWILEFTGILAIKDFYGHSPADLSMPATILFFVYSVNLRFSRTMRSIKLFSEKILVAHEEERKRLARELHDGLGQTLLTTKFNLQRMNLEKKERFIEGVIEELSGSIDELREISAGLRPPFLEEMGLAMAIRMFGHRVAEKTGMQVDIEADLDSRPPVRTEDNFFRIFQEALGNAAKHSGAEHVRVSLKRSKDRVIMEVVDDGLGFDYLKALSEGRGIGLNTMEERVNLMGGIFVVKSSTSKGTTIRVEALLR